MRGRQGPAIALLLVLLGLSLVLSLCVGAVRIPLHEVAGVLLAGDRESDYTDILLGVRLPRVVLAAIVGSSLAVAGAILQGLFGNPLADPYVIGVSSGASLGGVIAILLSPNLMLAGLGALPLFAMTGALLSILVVQRLSSVGGRSTAMGLLLAGVATSSFLQALISAFTYAFGTRVHQVWLWLVGGFSQASWELVLMASPYTLAGIACSVAFARDLNAIALGEDTASHLGVNVPLARNILVWTSALLTASAVSSAGLIGFVGMVVPHICRFVSPDHRFVIPSSALVGAISTLLADAAGRSLVPPMEIPVGIITSLVGGPLFAVLLRRSQRSRYGGPGGGFS